MDNEIKEIFEKDNFKKKGDHEGNKSINYDTMPRSEEVAFAQTLLLPKKRKNKKTFEESMQDVVVLGNEATSIDLMMPEEEREIIEKNLNLYSDMNKMVSILSQAKKNKKVSEDIKTLELISKSGNVSETIMDILTKEDNLEILEKYIQRKFEEGDIAKAYKELGMLSKIMLDARSEMIKGLNPKRNSKASKLDLHFTNNDGEEFHLGVDI